MAKLPRVVASVLVSLALVGCANSDLGPKQTIGALAGAGTGALIGAHIGHGRGRLVATSVGTLLGACLGNEAGKSLDRADTLYARRAEYRAPEYAPSGHGTAWRNPDTGHYGSVTSHLWFARVERRDGSAFLGPHPLDSTALGLLTRL